MVKTDNAYKKFCKLQDNIPIYKLLFSTYCLKHYLNIE